MNLSKFHGISEWHDGEVVSDYCNVIPMESTAVDKLGEILIHDTSDENFNAGFPRATFKSSLGDIYAVIGGKVLKCSSDSVSAKDFRWTRLQGRLADDTIGDFELKDLDDDVSICESSTKPSQIYLCDGKYAYQWNTETPDWYDSESGLYPAWVEKDVIRMLPSPGLLYRSGGIIKKAVSAEWMFWRNTSTFFNAPDDTYEFETLTYDSATARDTMRFADLYAWMTVPTTLFQITPSPNMTELEIFEADTLFTDQTIFDVWKSFATSDHTLQYVNNGLPVDTEYIVTPDTPLGEIISEMTTISEETGYSVLYYSELVSLYDWLTDPKSTRPYSTYTPIGWQTIYGRRITSIYQYESRPTYDGDDPNMLKILETAGTGIEWDTEDLCDITQIAWFDNKLVSVQKLKNTVWLSATDPNQFFRYDDEGHTDSSMWLFSETSSEVVTTSSANLVTTYSISSAIWPNYYSSTNSADRLNAVIAFGNVIWFENMKSIEPWVATGDESAPLTINRSGIIYFGAESAKIMNGSIYLICRDELGTVFVGTITGGAFSKASNPEIDRLIKSSDLRLRILNMRDTSFPVIDTVDGPNVYCCGSGNLWWRSPKIQTERIVESIDSTLAITTLGNLAEFDEESRSTINGGPIARSIRDWFVPFSGRNIVRSVELVMDSGRSLSIDRGDIYLSISTDRGHSFGPRFFRKLGIPGMNSSVVEWRNLGSGNSILLEFGTSANYKLQIYQIQLQLG